MDGRLWGSETRSPHETQPSGIFLLVLSPSKDYGAVIGRIAKGGSVASELDIAGFITAIFKPSKSRKRSHYASLRNDNGAHEINTNINNDYLKPTTPRLLTTGTIQLEAT